MEAGRKGAFVFKTTVQQLVDLVQGQLQGDPTCFIRAARPLQEAVVGEITFVENEQLLKHLKDCQASAVVVPLSLQTRAVPVLAGLSRPPAVILVKDALGAFLVIAQHLHGEPEPAPTASIPWPPFTLRSRLVPMSASTPMPSLVRGPGSAPAAGSIREWSWAGIAGLAMM